MRYATRLYTHFLEGVNSYLWGHICRTLKASNSCSSLGGSMTCIPHLALNSWHCHSGYTWRIINCNNSIKVIDFGSWPCAKRLHGQEVS